MMATREMRSVGIVKVRALNSARMKTARMKTMAMILAWIMMMRVRGAILCASFMKRKIISESIGSDLTESDDLSD